MTKSSARKAAAEKARSMNRKTARKVGAGKAHRTDRKVASKTVAEKARFVLPLRDLEQLANLARPAGQGSEDSLLGETQARTGCRQFLQQPS